MVPWWWSNAKETRNHNPKIKPNQTNIKPLFVPKTLNQYHFFLAFFSTFGSRVCWREYWRFCVCEKWKKERKKNVYWEHNGRNRVLYLGMKYSVIRIQSKEIFCVIFNSIACAYPFCIMLAKNLDSVYILFGLHNLSLRKI